jgi:NAD(P)-dependent dehydrogenase (short-subunit alcohol dehydrogenase family)
MNETSIDLDKTPFAARPAVALIIGCGDLGMSCSRALGRRHPLLIVDIDSDRLEKALSILRHEGYTASGHVCDIADAAQAQDLGKALKDGPGVHVLAHVAAVAKTDWKTVIRVNLIGPHLIAQAVGPHIVPGGVAILISSTAALHCPRDPVLEELIDYPFVPELESKIVKAYGHEPDFMEAYQIAKQGVNRLAERLAMEWGPQQVRVLSVSPGLINSTMGRTAGASMPVWDGGDKDRRVTRDEKARIETPLRRQASLPEITSVVDFLASDGASFVSGIDVPIDGGASVFWRKRGVIER